MNSLDIDKPAADTRVVVAMSGGVDSSVVAALLKHEGYDVLGVTLQLYNHGVAGHRAGSCCAGQDIDDARRVCETIDIAHYVLDYEKRFAEAVINPFAESYISGETPVPCISCNQTVKFSDLLKTAKNLGADALATGHYIRSRLNPSEQNPIRRALYRPLDTNRDQSYFLFATTQEQLDYVRFPLGDLPKSDTRILAEKMGLVVAQKPDSQDICFVPQGKYTSIVEKLHPDASLKGHIVHIDGRILGQHNGILHYTIGQRRGIGVSTGAPLYVVYIDARKHRVIVGPKEALESKSVILRDVNWLGDETLETIGAAGFDCFAKIRSTRPPSRARLSHINGVTKVDLIDGEEGIASGQACVLYSGLDDNARVFGGGFIKQSRHSEKIETMLNTIKETS